MIKHILIFINYTFNFLLHTFLTILFLRGRLSVFFFKWAVKKKVWEPLVYTDNQLPIRHANYFNFYSLSLITITICYIIIINILRRINIYIYILERISASLLLSIQ
jgi:hypothetical protein